MYFIEVHKYRLHQQEDLLFIKDGPFKLKLICEPLDLNLLIFPHLS